MPRAQPPCPRPPSATPARGLPRRLGAALLVHRCAFAARCAHPPSAAAAQPPLHTVRYVTADGTRVIKGVQRGELLRTALLRRGASPHNANPGQLNAQLINCRGIGSCGTCAVEIDGAAEPVAWTFQERARLSLPPHTGRAALRLACQVSVEGDLTVTKRDGGWGQGKALTAASPLAGVRYLGDLEYALDSQSPPPLEEEEEEEEGDEEEEKEERGEAGRGGGGGGGGGASRSS